MSISKSHGWHEPSASTKKRKTPVSEDQYEQESLRTPPGVRSYRTKVNVDSGQDPSVGIRIKIEPKIESPPQDKQPHPSCRKPELEGFLTSCLDIQNPKRGEHYGFSLQRCKEGFVAGLTVWAWSRDCYWGVPCGEMRSAEDEAVRLFLADPAVVQAASELIPETPAPNTGDGTSAANFTLEKLEAAKGMQFFQKGQSPNDDLVRFLGRYCNKQIKKDEDFEFSIQKRKEGFVVSVTVWGWSNDRYWGTPCNDVKSAKDAAVRAFLSDPEVIDAASKLPPPTKLVRQHVRSMLIASEVNMTPEEMHAEVERRMHEYISQQLIHCRNAYTDGRA